MVVAITPKQVSRRLVASSTTPFQRASFVDRLCSLPSFQGLFRLLVTTRWKCRWAARPASCFLFSRFSRWLLIAPQTHLSTNYYVRLSATRSNSLQLSPTIDDSSLRHTLSALHTPFPRLHLSLNTLNTNEHYNIAPAPHPSSYLTILSLSSIAPPPHHLSSFLRSYVPLTLPSHAPLYSSLYKPITTPCNPQPSVSVHRTRTLQKCMVSHLPLIHRACLTRLDSLGSWQGGEDCGR